jgi:hypothetical protein
MNKKYMLISLLLISFSCLQNDRDSNSRKDEDSNLGKLSFKIEGPHSVDTLKSRFPNIEFYDSVAKCYIVSVQNTSKDTFNVPLCTPVTFFPENALYYNCKNNWRHIDWKGNCHRGLKRVLLNNEKDSFLFGDVSDEVQEADFVEFDFNYKKNSELVKDTLYFSMENGMIKKRVNKEDICKAEQK